jgi:hypothetical protein
MKRMPRFWSLPCLIVVALTGCTSLTVVKADPQFNAQRYTTLVVGDFENVAGNAPPFLVQQNLPEAVIAHLKECYAGAFERIVRSGSGNAEELVIRGSVTEYQEGNRALRFLAAGLGSAKIAADVSFYDGQSGQQLMLAKGDWVLRPGGLVGAALGIDDVVRSAGAQIADLIAEKRGATKMDTQACRASAV